MGTSDGTLWTGQDIGQLTGMLWAAHGHAQPVGTGRQEPEAEEAKEAEAET